MALGQWQELADYLGKAHWMGLDAVRVGMMSLAAWKEFDDQRYTTTWQQAILLAAHSPNLLNTLAQMAAVWGWKEQTKDVLWFAAGKHQAESWPLTSLEKSYAEQRDTAGLRRVFGAMVKKDPQDAQARNNFAMVSLLLGVNPLTTGAVEVEARDGVLFIFIGSQFNTGRFNAPGDCLLI